MAIQIDATCNTSIPLCRSPDTESPEDEAMDHESPAVRARRQTMKFDRKFFGALLIGSLFCAPLPLLAADQLQTRDRLHTQDPAAVQLQTRDRLHAQDPAAVQLQTRSRLHAQDRAMTPKADRAQKRNRARQ
jgi:hypothetical protein